MLGKLKTCSRLKNPFLFGVIVALFLLSEVPAGFADSCEDARHRYARIGPEITDFRVLTAANAAIQASGFQGHVVTCVLLMPYVNATVEKIGSSYYVSITKSLIERLGDAELRAVLGHEMAHIVLGHRAPAFELTHHRVAKYEQQADALSAEWFGRPAMRSVIEQLRLDALRLPIARQRRQALAELDARLKSLQ